MGRALAARAHGGPRGPARPRLRAAVLQQGARRSPSRVRRASLLKRNGPLFETRCVQQKYRLSQFLVSSYPVYGRLSCISPRRRRRGSLWQRDAKRRGCRMSSSTIAGSADEEGDRENSRGYAHYDDFGGRLAAALLALAGCPPPLPRAPLPPPPLPPSALGLPTIVRQRCSSGGTCLSFWAR